MKTIHSLLLFLLVISLGCSQQPPLSGNIKTTEAYSNRVYLIDPVGFDGIATSYRGEVLDSALIAADGSFAFMHLPDAPRPMLLQLVVQQRGERYLNKLQNDNIAIANYFPFVWQNGDRIELTAEAAHFQGSLTLADPSPQNEALLRLRDIRQAAYRELKEKAIDNPHDAEQLLAAEKAHLAFQQPLMEFARTSQYLLPAMTAIRWTSISGDYERIPEFIFNQCQQWKAEWPDHPWVAQLCQYGRKEALPVLQGDLIPDSPLPMLSGDTTNLHQLLGQKLTLLDLWASWCAPCRRENREVLVPLWEQYQEEGLQIIAYALDASAHVWQKAIERDGADRWLQASHLEGDDSPFFEELRISTIPANFLLDAEGRVIGKNLHGEELKKVVAEYFDN